MDNQQEQLSPIGNLKITDYDIINVSTKNAISILKGRRVVNGQEAEGFQELKPLGTKLDLLFVEYDQLKPKLVTTIADSLGKLTTPMLTEKERLARGWTPRRAIKECLTTHGFDVNVWEQGVLILSTQRSELLKHIYAAEQPRTTACNMGDALREDHGKKACIYIDDDVFNRLKNQYQFHEKQPEEEEKEDGIEELIYKMEQKMVCLQDEKLVEKFKYQPPEVLAKIAEQMFSDAEDARRMLSRLNSMVTNREIELRNEVNVYKNKLKENHNISEEMAVEMQMQMKIIVKTLKATFFLE